LLLKVPSALKFLEYAITVHPFILPGALALASINAAPLLTAAKTSSLVAFIAVLIFFSSIVYAAGST